MYACVKSFYLLYAHACKQKISTHSAEIKKKWGEYSLTPVMVARDT